MCSAPCEGGEAGSRLTIPLALTHVLSLAQHTTTKLFTANSCKAKCGLIVVQESRTGKLRCYHPLLRKAAEHKPKEMELPEYRVGSFISPQTGILKGMDSYSALSLPRVRNLPHES